MVRVGIQCGVATLVIMASFSTPAVWEALSFDPILANSTLFLVFTCLALMFQVGTGLAVAKLATEFVAGSLVGATLSFGVMYAAYGANGGSWEDSVGKAFAVVAFGSICIFGITLVRFRYRQHTIACIAAGLGVAIPPAGIYHTTNMHQLWQLPLYWYVFGTVPAVFIVLVGTFVLPVPTGGVVRRRLAKVLRNTGAIVTLAVDLLTSELDPATGCLAAATGDTTAGGSDAGLDALAHLPGGWWEWDAYRRQHRLPAAAHANLLLLARTLLSAAMNMTYSLQTGRLQLTAVSKHADGLRHVASAFRAAAAALADVLQHSGHTASVEDACYRLGQLEATLLFACATRLRRMMALLPEALGADVPTARIPVARHVATAWDLAAMSHASHAGIALGRVSASMLRRSLLEGPPGEAMGGRGAGAPSPVDLLQQLGRPTMSWVVSSQKSIKLGEEGSEGCVAAAARRARSGAHGAVQQIEAATGFALPHLALACQAVASYVATMVLVIVPSVQAALDHRAVWAVFMSVVLHEPVAGGVVWKAILRLGGTVAAGLLGLGAIYFTLLVNGLSYENQPGKFVAMTAVLTAYAVPLGAGCVRYGTRNAYFWVVSLLIAFTVALPGYASESPMPILALWRLVCTALGAAIQLLASTLVFPVTACQAYTQSMAGAVKGMATVADAAFHAVMPGPRGPQPPGAAQQAGEGSKHGSSRAGSRHGALALPGPRAAPPASPLCSAPGSPLVGQSPAALSPVAFPRLGRSPRVTVEPPHGGLPDSPLLGSPTAAHASQAAGAAATSPTPAAAATSPAPTGAGAGGAAARLMEANAAAAGPSAAHEEHAVVEVTQGAAQTGGAPAPAACVAADAPAGAEQKLLRGEVAVLVDASNPRTAEQARQQVRRLMLEQELAQRPSLDHGQVERSSLEQEQVQGPELSRASPAPTDTTARSTVSVYADVGAEEQQRVFGRVLMKIRGPSTQVASMLASLGPLSNAVAYEFNPCARPRRFPVAAGRRAARLARRQLSVLTTFAIIMDSHHTSRLPLLAPHAPECAGLVEQLCEALRGMAGIVLGEAEPRRRGVGGVAQAVLSLEVHVQQLLLRVLLTEPPAGLADSDVIQGLAFAAVLLNTAIVARLLCVALAEAFCTGAAVGEVQRLLSSTARWAVDDELLSLAHEIASAGM
eukprot:scaffold25.g5115.t1